MRPKTLNFHCCTILFLCATSLCQSINVNSKNHLNNKKIIEMDAENEDSSHEFGRTELLNSEYDSDNDLDKLASNSLPFFMLEPEDAFIIKGRPTELVCQTAHALKVKL